MTESDHPLPAALGRNGGALDDATHPSAAERLWWLVRGERAALEWSALEGLYTATVPRLAGCSARGRTRTEALAELSRALASYPAEPRPRRR